MNFLRLILFAFVGLVPLIASAEAPAVPDKYKDAKWLLYETPNFEIVALNSEHAMQVQNYAEDLKSWIYNRWGLHDIPFDKKCMIVCVPSQEMFVEFFRKPDVDPKVATSKNPDGSDRQVYGIWIAASSDNRWLTASLPEKLGRVCLLNYESTYKLKFENWFYVGSSALNNDPGAILTVLAGQPQNIGIDQLFSSEPTASSEAYRYHAMVLCLMLRKEFGIAKLKQFLLSSNKDLNTRFREVYGFADAASFGISYNAYVKNLHHDIHNNRTPVTYLTWFFIRKNHEKTLFIFSWIFFGLVAGVLSRVLYPVQEKFNWVETMLLGVAGSFVGGTINHMLQWGDGTFSPVGLLLSVAGGVLACIGWNFLKKRLDL